MTSLAVLGLFIAPRRTLAAFRAEGIGSSPFAMDDPRELLDLTIDARRQWFGIPEWGLATTRRQLHADAPRPGAC